MLGLPLHRKSEQQKSDRHGRQQEVLPIIGLCASLVPLRHSRDSPTVSGGYPPRRQEGGQPSGNRSGGGVRCPNGSPNQLR